MGHLGPPNSLSHSRPLAFFFRCINDCGEIQPTLNTTARSATSNELSAIMENFADYLRSGWGLGNCGNDVVILYAQDIDRVRKLIYMYVYTLFNVLVRKSVKKSLKIPKG